MRSWSFILVRYCSSDSGTSAAVLKVLRLASGSPVGFPIVSPKLGGGAVGLCLSRVSNSDVAVGLCKLVGCLLYCPLI